jgi:hypothetical protein
MEPEAEQKKCSITNPIACIKEFFSGVGKKVRRNYIDRVDTDKIIGNRCETFNFERGWQTIPISDGEFEPSKDIFGRSIGGFDTSFTIPKFGITMDAGPAIAELKPEDKVFISHTDGDHIKGLKALMCMSIGREKPYEVYISKNARPYVEKVQEEMGECNDGIQVNFNYVAGGDELEIDENTKYEFFDVIHTPTSVGISINKRDKENGEWNRELTYTGDVSISDMKRFDMINDTPQMWDTKTLIVENSIPSSMKGIVPFMELVRARHSSIDDIDWLVEKGNHGSRASIDNLVMVHTLGMVPMVIGCKENERDIMNHFADNDFDSYYLTTCRDKMKIRNEPRKAVKVIYFVKLPP